MNIEINYHKCDNCSGYYFMPCGCSLGDTWCVDCEPYQKIIKSNPCPIPELSVDNNVSVMLDKLESYEKCT